MDLSALRNGELSELLSAGMLESGRPESSAVSGESGAGLLT